MIIGLLFTDWGLLLVTSGTMRRALNGWALGQPIPRLLLTVPNVTTYCIVIPWWASVPTVYYPLHGTDV